jgi:non-ribosomal peptide synthetase component F
MGALLNGGCVVVHGEAVPTGAGLARTIARHGVTTAWLTAALFNTVVDEDPLQLAAPARAVHCGEALSVDHVRRMRSAAPQTRLRNGYGPTECTTFTCTHAIDDVPVDSSSIPIGARSPIRRCMCSMRGASWCRSARSASCTWVARAWRAVISSARN